MEIFKFTIKFSEIWQILPDFKSKHIYLNLHFNIYYVIYCYLSIYLCSISQNKPKDTVFNIFYSNTAVFKRILLFFSLL